MVERDRSRDVASGWLENRQQKHYLGIDEV